MMGSSSTLTVWPRRNLCSSKSGATSKQCVFKRLYSLPHPLTFRIGCFVELVCLEGIHRIHGSSTLPRPHHAMGIPTRGASSALSRLQDPNVQLQCPCMRVHHAPYRCRLALLRHLSPNQHNRQLWPPYDRRNVLGLVRFVLHVLCYHHRR